MSERRSDAILPFVLFSRLRPVLHKCWQLTKCWIGRLQRVCETAAAEEPSDGEDVGAMFFLMRYHTIAANRREINFGAPVLQGESGPQDGNQGRAPAFRGHSFAACIHFLVGRFLSPPVRRCKETKLLTVRPRVVPFACAPVTTSGSFLWVEMAAGHFDCRLLIDKAAFLCSTTARAALPSVRRCVELSIFALFC